MVTATQSREYAKMVRNFNEQEFNAYKAHLLDGKPAESFFEQLKESKSGFLKYSEDQPRDDHGRWTDGGGDTSIPAPVTGEQAIISTMNQQRDAGYKPTDAQLKSIEDYTSGHTYYSSINTYLRTGEWQGGESETRQQFLKETINNLDQVIADAPRLENDMVSYRGVWGQDAVQAFGQLKVGDTFKEPAFSSTSLDEQVAKNFARYDKANGGIVMEIVNPAGSQGIFPLAAQVKMTPEFVTGIYASEKEWLLPRLSTFEVIKNEGRKITVKVK